MRPQHLCGWSTLAPVLLCVSLSSAATLEWNRTADTDMKDYQVYGCFTAGCTPLDSPATLLGTVAQPSAAVKPTLAVAIEGKEGALSVIARDQSLNRSGLSVPLPFDKVAPSAPAGLTLR